MSELKKMNTSANGTHVSGHGDFSSEVSYQKEIDETEYHAAVNTDDVSLPAESSSVSTHESTLTSNSLPVVSSTTTIKDVEHNLATENTISSSNQELELPSSYLSSEVPAQLFTDSPSEVEHQESREEPEESWMSLEESPKTETVGKILVDSNETKEKSIETSRCNSGEEGVEVMRAPEKFELDTMCRLCGIPCKDLSLMPLFCGPPHKTQGVSSTDDGKDELLAMIKATLPIKVSCCDTLPKQVCIMCVDRVRAWNAFTTAVLEADNHLQALSSGTKKSAPTGLSSSTNTCLNCPICCEEKLKSSSLKRSGTFVLNPLAKRSSAENISWDEVAVKLEPEELPEPSSEEMERTYHKLFKVEEPVSHTLHSWTEERLALQPKKPFPEVVRRPRGRPRTRPKVTPRGRRGRRSMCTTVERILELGHNSYCEQGCSIQVRSGERSAVSQALTQCLLCERWLPGSAACLQHSLAEHTDCGAFLCPRCPRDDFPGDFELIQHFQEVHCHDLELYEICESENVVSSADTTQEMEWETETHETHPSPPVVDADKELEVINDIQEGGLNLPEKDDHLPQEQIAQPREQDQTWHVEAMEFESSNTDTPSQEQDESQDDVSSNLSEPAPRSLTSHSAIYEEESNSISTQESESNLILEEHSTSEQTCERPEDISEQLPDQLLDQESMLDTPVSESAQKVTKPCIVRSEEDDPDDLDEREEDDDDEEVDESHNNRKNNDDDNDDQGEGSSGNGESNDGMHDVSENHDGESQRGPDNVPSSDNGKDKSESGDQKSANLAYNLNSTLHSELCLLCRGRSTDLRCLCSHTCYTTSAQEVLLFKFKENGHFIQTSQRFSNLTEKDLYMFIQLLGPFMPKNNRIVSNSYHLKHQPWHSTRSCMEIRLSA